MATAIVIVAVVAVAAILAVVGIFVWVNVRASGPGDSA